MRINYQDKIILLLGAAGGIGGAIAAKLAAADATLILSDLDDGRLNSLADSLRQSGVEFEVRTCDVGEARQQRELVEQLVSQFGRIDVAINNAGVLHPYSKLADLDINAYQASCKVNLDGVFLGMKYQLGQMKKQRSGVILNVSSIAGLYAAAGLSAYAASKHAVSGLTRTAAVEYARYGIRINALCPSYIEGPMVTQWAESSNIDPAKLDRMNPMGRLGTADEVANAALWLCSDQNSYMTGQCVVLDGGLSAF